MAVPIAALIGYAFAALGMAATTFMRGWADFEYVPAATLPLFLFSATFYPVSAYGDYGWVVQLSPLYHGVELVRSANLGVWGWADLAHVGVVAVSLVVAGEVVDEVVPDGPGVGGQPQGGLALILLGVIVISSGVVLTLKIKFKKLYE